MNDANSKDLVRRFVQEVQSAGRLDLLDHYMASGFVDHSALPGFEPDREGVRKLFGTFRAAFPDLRVIVYDQVAEAGRVATRKSFTGTHLGSFMGIPPSGNRIDFEVIDILCVADNQITDHWMVGDMLGLMRQVGAIPS